MSIGTPVALGSIQGWTFWYLPLVALAPATVVIAGSAGVAKGATKKARICKLVGPLTVSGTVQILNGAVDMTGAMTVIAGQPGLIYPSWPQDIQFDGIPITPGSDASLVIVTGTLNGYAVIAVEN
jgi:hypothetical protein